MPGERNVKRYAKSIRILSSVKFFDNSIIIRTLDDRHVGDSSVDLEIKISEAKLIAKLLKAKQDAIDGGAEGASTAVSGVPLADSYEEPMRESSGSSAQPPVLGEFLIGLTAPPDIREALLGDLDESFRRDLVRFGKRRATVQHYAQVVRSLAPLLWTRTKKLGGWLFGFLVGLSSG